MIVDFRFKKRLYRRIDYGIGRLPALHRTLLYRGTVQSSYLPSSHFLHQTCPSSLHLSRNVPVS